MPPLRRAINSFDETSVWDAVLKPCPAKYAPKPVGFLLFETKVLGPEGPTNLCCAVRFGGTVSHCGLTCRCHRPRDLLGAIDITGSRRLSGTPELLARMTAKAATKGAVLTAKAANAASPESEKGAQLR